MKAITAIIILAVALYVGSDLVEKAENVGSRVNARHAQALNIGQ